MATTESEHNNTPNSYENERCRPDSESTHESAEEGNTEVSARRDRRARQEVMDIALLRQGGIYEIRSESGGVYRVDLLELSCTCPDHESSSPGSCKHLRRVELDVRAGRVPRPDGKLPANYRAIEATDGGSNLENTPSHNGATTRETLLEKDVQKVREHESALLKAQLVSEMQDREEEMARLDAELQALQFVYDVLKDLGTDDGFDFDSVLADEYGPASQL